LSPSSSSVLPTCSFAVPALAPEALIAEHHARGTVVGCLSWLLGMQRLLLAVFAHVGVGRPSAASDTYQRLQERSEHTPTPIISYHNALKLCAPAAPASAPTPPLRLSVLRLSLSGSPPS
jgi:hypothetical protein